MGLSNNEERVVGETQRKSRTLRYLMYVATAPQCYMYNDRSRTSIHIFIYSHCILENSFHADLWFGY